MERELQHFLHKHPLVLNAELFHEPTLDLNAEQPKTRDSTTTNDEFKCDGCSTPLLGPFYSCKECPYYLHKVCAELPSALDHPLHPEHPLALCPGFPYETGDYCCNLCRDDCDTFGSAFIYRCFICSFFVDMKCASATHMIHDKCHPHPLTSIQVPKSINCHICLKKKKGVSYKCNVCPFWVHQNCTLLPDTVIHSDHRHPLTLLPSVPSKYSKICGRCDICYSKLFMFQSTYSCVGCQFFSHVSCARSETIRDENIDGQSVIRLPIKQDSTDIISQFVRNYIDGDANINEKIDHFFHKHPLSLIDEDTNYNKTCEACAIRISAPSYGCIVGCDYFLHKCCTDLPEQICHPIDPEHQLVLRTLSFFKCSCCSQWCNSFCYKGEEDFVIDIKCASILQGIVYYEAHKHLLISRNKPLRGCTACGIGSVYNLQCDTCSFELCVKCAMAPAVIKHRYGGILKEDFRLTYFPPENPYSDEYLCEICLKELNPKKWHYHCVFGDQFAHVGCMVRSGADSNIKYGNMFRRRLHEHELNTIRCTYDCSPCSRCDYPMRIIKLWGGGGVGFECKTCNFRCHLQCLIPMFEWDELDGSDELDELDGSDELDGFDELDE